MRLFSNWLLEVLSKSLQRAFPARFKWDSPNLDVASGGVLHQSPLSPFDSFHVSDSSLEKGIVSRSRKSEGLHAARHGFVFGDGCHVILNIAKDRGETLRHTNFILCLRAKRLTEG